MHVCSSMDFRFSEINADGVSVAATQRVDIPQGLTLQHVAAFFLQCLVAFGFDEVEDVTIETVDQDFCGSEGPDGEPITYEVTEEVRDGAPPFVHEDAEEADGISGDVALALEFVKGLGLRIPDVLTLEAPKAPEVTQDAEPEPVFVLTEDDAAILRKLTGPLNNAAAAVKGVDGAWSYPLYVALCEGDFEPQCSPARALAYYRIVGFYGFREAKALGLSSLDTEPLWLRLREFLMTECGVSTYKMDQLVPLVSANTDVAAL